MENSAKSEKPEPVVKKKKNDQKAMSVHEGKMFQCSICKCNELPTEFGNAGTQVLLIANRIR